jgi:hypothetical protein
VQPDDPARGAEQPLVTIVQFDDMASPACGALSALLEVLLAQHPKELRLVWKDRPIPTLRPLGLTAALFGRHAFETEGHDGFWRLQRVAVERLARDPEAHAVSPVGALFGVPEATADVHSKRTALGVKIDESMRLSLALGVRSTPYLFVNGRALPGLPTLEALEAAVQQELAIARSLLARGIARTDVHAERTKQGTRPQPAMGGEPVYGPGRKKPKHDAEDELDIAARDTRPVEFSRQDLAELEKRNLDPDKFAELVKIKRARELMVERAVQARQQAAAE